MQFELIESKRLILRKLTPEVFDHIHKNYSDGELKTFLGLKDNKELTKEKEKYNKGLSTFHLSFLYFQIIDKSSEAVMGWCGYHIWYLKHNRAELGYVLQDNSFMNKGFMSEALEIILPYGFNTMKLHRIEATVGKENKASLRILEKLGFELEGTLKEHYKVEDMYHDSLIYSLISQEK